MNVLKEARLILGADHSQRFDIHNAIQTIYDRAPAEAQPQQMQDHWRQQMLQQAAQINPAQIKR
jgi:hypothetical protein